MALLPHGLLLIMNREECKQCVGGDGECIIKHSQEPRVVLAHGLEEAILVECTVGVVIQAHLKNSHETITNPKVINSERKIQKTIIKQTAVRKKAKTGLFQSDSVPELNTKDLGNSPIFLPISHMNLSA
jgi:hypothetical protein